MIDHLKSLGLGLLVTACVGIAVAAVVIGLTTYPIILWGILITGLSYLIGKSIREIRK